MKTKKIKINDKEFEVEKMPLGRLKDLLDALKELPDELVKEDITVDKIVKELPALLAEYFDSLIKVLSIASGVEEDYLKKEVGLVEATKLVVTVFEVNEFEEIKNVVSAAFQKKRTAQKSKTGSKK